MPDHINIEHPDIRDRHEEYRKRIMELETEVRRLGQINLALSGDLESIFTRIWRGDTVELHYPRGGVIVVAKAGEADDQALGALELLSIAIEKGDPKEEIDLRINDLRQLIERSGIRTPKGDQE